MNANTSILQFKYGLNAQWVRIIVKFKFMLSVKMYNIFIFCTKGGTSQKNAPRPYKVYLYFKNKFSLFSFVRLYVRMKQ